VEVELGPSMKTHTRYGRYKGKARLKEVRMSWDGHSMKSEAGSIYPFETH
jgi:hypothetical protein